jgi:hypothetical protein
MSHTLLNIHSSIRRNPPRFAPLISAAEHAVINVAISTNITVTPLVNRVKLIISWSVARPKYFVLVKSKKTLPLLQTWAGIL